MGFQFDVMFIDSFMDDVTYVRDVEVWVERRICYIPGCSWYGSENRVLRDNKTRCDVTFLLRFRETGDANLTKRLAECTVRRM